MFIVVLGAVLALMHVYLWKRLIKDTTRPGRVRWALTAALLVLAGLLIGALMLPWAVGPAGAGWFAWPGYIWFGLAAYLVLILLTLEPVRLVLRRWVRGKPESTEKPATSTELSRRLFLARASAVAAGAVGLVGVGTATALGPPDLLRVPVRLRNLDPAFHVFASRWCPTFISGRCRGGRTPSGSSP